MTLRSSNRGLGPFVVEDIRKKRTHRTLALVISAAGFLVGPFECSALAPTSVDILRFAVQYATQFNRQPKVLSIDERVCCDRVKFLLGETDSKIRVEYYRPPSKEESDAAMAMGDMR